MDYGLSDTTIAAEAHLSDRFDPLADPKGQGITHACDTS